MAETISNVIVVSDLHCGCQVGLCPPQISLDSGGVWRHGPTQAAIWSVWRHFWDVWVPAATRGEPFAVVINGDAMDGAHHGSKTQITQNFADQEKIAYEVIAPVRDACQGRLRMIRGTEAHVGQCAENEERLARRIGAIPDELGNHSSYDLWLEIGHGLAHFTHHIGTTSRVAYETSALMGEFAEMLTDAGLNQRRPPDVVCRCLSEDTEVLVRGNGWVNLDAFLKWRGMPLSEIEVATFNAFTGEIQWQSPTDSVVNENEPEMVNMTGKGVDILVTPDHTMVVRSRSNRWGLGGWRPMLMDDVVEAMPAGGPRSGSLMQIPVAGHYNGSGAYLDATATEWPRRWNEAELWLVGLFMADGSYVKAADGRAYAGRIAQVASRSDEVEARLEAAGVSGWTKSLNAKAGNVNIDPRDGEEITTREDVFSWYLPKEYCISRLFPALMPDKSLAPHMDEMTREQFMALLAGFHYGDGAKEANKLFGSNKRMLDGLQSLLVRHGCKSNLSPRAEYTNQHGERVVNYCLNYCPGTTAVGIGQKRQGHDFARVEYGKRSWCFTVPNGTLVTRRNGCVAIVGNSHRHRHVEVRKPSANVYGIVFTTACWQARTPYVWKVARVGDPQIGGSLIRCGDEELYTRHFTQFLPRSGAVSFKG